MAIAPGGMPPPADTGLEDTGPTPHDHPAKCPAQGSSAREMLIPFPKDQEGEGISLARQGELAGVREMPGRPSFPKVGSPIHRPGVMGANLSHQLLKQRAGPLPPLSWGHGRPQAVRLKAPNRGLRDIGRCRRRNQGVPKGRRWEPPGMAGIPCLAQNLI